jgi:RHS repeat-associated protein
VWKFENGVMDIYYDNLDDHRLQEIWNQGSGANTISKFDYTYDSEGEIQSWTQQMGATNNVYSFQYDAASQLIEAFQSGAAVSTNEYVYDAAGNRLSERINGALTGASYNNVNELTSQSGGGLLRFRGSINETSTVSVAGVSASITWTNIAGTNTLFDASASVNVGTNVVPVIAQDYNGNVRTNNYRVVVTGGVTNTLTYDLNGNLTAVSNQQSVVSYQWDAANRLVALESSAGVSPVSRSEFAYDGFSRRVRQIEISGTTTNSDHRMLWCKTQLCEERDSTGATVTKRLFREGEQIAGTNYFFTRDHLGSIREMTDPSGTTRARYDYDPWGRRTKVSGDLEADFGFTGHYFHAPSGLHMALYRAYGAELGRWLSRDPIEEKGGHFTGEDPLGFEYGINLYAYPRNNPVSYIDPLGLGPLIPAPGPTPPGSWKPSADFLCSLAKVVKACKSKEGPKNEDCLAVCTEFYSSVSGAFIETCTEDCIHCKGSIPGLPVYTKKWWDYFFKSK